ncbi:hypothetical protein GCM10009821_25360 [Aeromicrobium halocynthiae]|uniref:ABC transmembrane type-1 domain-containing protein n=1 Tax=Aeromicrobium halocynthiae TaxID=560557 RepID=A0ABN2W6K9_9ACTN
MLVVLGVVGWPLVVAVRESLFQSSLVVPDDRTFVGIETVASVFSSSTWWSAVAVTLALVVVAVALQLVLAAAFATALRRLTHGTRWLQVLLLVPFATLAVVTAVTWRDGLTAGFAPAWFGYDVDSRSASMAAVVAAEVWRGTGITTVILLAGLARVPSSLREAAVADGATAWQRVWRVTRPAAAPAIAVAVVYRSLDALRALEAPLMADAAAPRTVSTLVWDTTFETFEVGLGAALSLGLLLLAVLVGVALAVTSRMRRTL